MCKEIMGNLLPRKVLHTVGWSKYENNGTAIILSVCAENLASEISSYLVTRDLARFGQVSRSIARWTLSGLLDSRLEASDVRTGQVNAQPCEYGEEYLIAKELEWLVLRCPKLQSLCADHAAFNKIRDCHLLTLADFASNIKELRLAGARNLTDEGVKHIATSCSNLVLLDISCCQHISDEALIALGDMRPNTAAASLIHLNLAQCQGISDKGIKSFAARNGSLEFLDLSYVRNVGDAAIMALGTHCKQMKAIYLLKCDPVSNESMCVLAENCPSLEKLDISRTSVTDIGLSTIAINCPKLSMLDISHLTNITDNSMLLVACHLLALECLRLSWCESITDDSMLMVFHNCARLQELYAVDAHSVTDLSLNYLRQRSPRCLIYASSW